MIPFAVLTSLYFLPSIIASHRGHPMGSILILNVLFGWTGIGWLALIFWALISRPPLYCIPLPYPYYGWRRY